MVRTTLRKPDMIERLIITKSGDNMSKSHKFDNNDNNDAAIDPCVKRAVIRLGDPFSVNTPSLMQLYC